MYAQCDNYGTFTRILVLSCEILEENCSLLANRGKENNNNMLKNMEEKILMESKVNKCDHGNQDTSDNHVLTSSQV
jgi:hypothetical protein